MSPAPTAVTKELAGLRKAVRSGVPARESNNLLIGSWNLRAFGDLTEKWDAGPTDSPKRDWRSVALIPVTGIHAVAKAKRQADALLERTSTMLRDRNWP